MKKNTNSAFIYLVTLLVAACSIVYELLLANEISLACGNTVIWYSLVIGVYLGFLGAGSLVYARFFKKNKLEKKLLTLEISLSFSGAVAVLLVKFSHILSIFTLAHGFGTKSFVVLFGTSFVLVALIGFLSGVELPVLMDIVKKNEERDFSNRVLAADYFGSLLGAVAFPLFLVPFFSGIRIGLFVAALNFSVAIGLIFFYKIKVSQARRLFVFLVLGAVFLVLGATFSERIEQVFAKKYYYYPQVVESAKSLFGSTKDFPEVFHRQSPYQAIDLVNPVEFSFSDVLVNAYIDWNKIDQPEDIDEKVLYLNGDWQLATTTERVYHEYFAHVPVQAAEKVPAKVLLLGGGDGMLLREILKYPAVESVIQVELDKAVIDVVKEDQVLSKVNGNSFADSRVELIYGDGFSFLQKNQEKFDAIYVDFPVPKDYNVSKLYSRELYSFANRSLVDDGYLAIYAPALNEFQRFDENDWAVVDQEKTPWKEYYNALKAAGFVTVLPFFSNLERDNMSARVLAEELIDGHEKQRVAGSPEIKIDEDLLRDRKLKEIDSMMESFSVSMQESFIFAQKKLLKGNLNYVDFGANYAVMNKRRFMTSFQVLLERKKGVDWQYVNSILKPTLPKASPWMIRFPYYLQ